MSGRKVGAESNIPPSRLTVSLYSVFNSFVRLFLTKRVSFAHLYAKMTGDEGIIDLENDFRQSTHII